MLVPRYSNLLKIVGVIERHVLQQERWEEPGAEYMRPSSKGGTHAVRTEPASAGGTATAAQPRAVANGQDLGGGQLPGSEADETPASGGRLVKRYIPYSLGSQDCVGQNLARHSMPASLAMLFSHFTFQLAAEACHSGPVCRAARKLPCTATLHLHGACYSRARYAFTTRECLREHQRCESADGRGQGHVRGRRHWAACLHAAPRTWPVHVLAPSPRPERHEGPAPRPRASDALHPTRVS